MKMYNQTNIMVYAVILMVAVICFNYLYKKIKKMNAYDKKNANVILFFDFNKHALNKTNKKMLNDYFSTRDKQYEKICIVGHADPVGNKKVNARFGYLRAIDTLQCLNQIGVNSKKFRIMSKDYSDPMHKSHHHLNRRVEIHLS